MYLFVSIFLLLAAMGLFTEVYLLQISRIWANQKAAAESVFVFHAAAYRMAKEEGAQIMDSAALSCRLSTNALPASAEGNCFVQLGTGSSYLPDEYPTVSEFLFPSVIYKSGSGRYLATFIPKESDGGTSALGYKAGEIYRQMQRSSLSGVSYGYVADTTCRGTYGHWFVTNATHNNTRICFPAFSGISVGSVGFISIL